MLLDHADDLFHGKAALPHSSAPSLGQPLHQIEGSSGGGAVQSAMTPRLGSPITLLLIEMPCGGRFMIWQGGIPREGVPFTRRAARSSVHQIKLARRHSGAAGWWQAGLFKLQLALAGWPVLCSISGGKRLSGNAKTVQYSLTNEGESAIDPLTVFALSSIYVGNGVHHDLSRECCSGDAVLVVPGVRCVRRLNWGRARKAG